MFSTIDNDEIEFHGLVGISCRTGNSKRITASVFSEYNTSPHKHLRVDVNNFADCSRPYFLRATTISKNRGQQIHGNLNDDCVRNYQKSDENIL